MAAAVVTDQVDHGRTINRDIKVREFRELDTVSGATLPKFIIWLKIPFRLFLIIHNPLNR